MAGLANKRVLVTRARDQAEKTAAAIRARGAEPVLLPTIALHPPEDVDAVARALAAARDFAWVAFTSANGVEHTWRALEHGGLDARVFAESRIAAIGPGTAQALAERGARVDLVATELRGEGLAAALLGAMEPRDALLLLRAKVSRDALPDALRAAGHAVEIVAVYETRAAEGGDVDAVARDLEAGAIDAVTFTSGSTVDAFVAMAGGADRARELLGRTRVASIGPITSEALARHGLRIDCVAREPTLAALLDAIEESASGRT